MGLTCCRGGTFCHSLIVSITQVLKATNQIALIQKEAYGQEYSDKLSHSHSEGNSSRYIQSIRLAIALRNEEKGGRGQIISFLAVKRKYWNL